MSHEHSPVRSSTRICVALALGVVAAGCRAAPQTGLDPGALPFALDSSRTTQVADGAAHHFFYAREGPWAVHVLEARTDRCWVPVALKSSGGAVGRATTSALVREAAAHEPVAGAVNADFFLFTPPGVPVGLMVADGQVIAGPIAQPAFAVDSSGRVHIARFEMRGHIESGGVRHPITEWNRAAAKGVALFDRGWGASTDTASGILEIGLEGHGAYRVSRTDTATAGIGIPAAGAVLRLGRDAPAPLQEAMRSLEAGDSVRISVSLAPFHPRDAVGGRPVLVSRGVVAARLDTVGRQGFAMGRHPRTAAGLTRDGQRLLLVTVDGRQAPYSDGMSLPELASLMLALGAWEAVNLDGGGSTAMVISEGSGGFRLANRPSDGGGERAVGNAVALARRCRP
jgi:exopolysaccharide biosynthesis protein